MISFKVILSSILGGRTITYVRANSIDEARRKAEAKVGRKSTGWRANEVLAIYPPEGYVDAWDN